MKYIINLLFLFVFSSQDQIDTSKALIIYFTRTGNTELFANYIKEKMNIELFKIVPAYPYPEDNDEMSKVCQEEQSSNARPEIKDPLTDVSEYDTILLGTPIWYGHIPNIVMTQLEKLNLNGKTIYPFNTHGGSGVGSTVTDIKQYAIGANVKDGFPLCSKKILKLLLTLTVRVLIILILRIQVLKVLVILIPVLKVLVVIIQLLII